MVISSDAWLTKVVPGVAFPGYGPTVLPDNVTLNGGDSNGDNAVSFEDFSILQNSYGQTGVSAASPLRGGRRHRRMWRRREWSWRSVWGLAFAGWVGGTTSKKPGSNRVSIRF